MLGGYQILDLRNIDLSRATTESSITDVKVLKQLSQIAEHIQKTYDFSKPLHAQLKPLLIRYRDKKVGEKHEVALYGNIEVINTYYKFRIIANNEGEQLTINVEFEEKTDEYYNKYWDIKTAKILLTSEVAIFENITDKDGHKRFTEGDIAIQEITGVTKIYGKWSLSGSHLLIVLCISIADTTVLTNQLKLCDINIPEWLFSKIYPIMATNVIEYKSGNMAFNPNGWDYQIVPISLKKTIDKLVLGVENNVTMDKDRVSRIAFDLLIDNE